MGNCLVTKMKEVVDNNNLTTFNKVIITLNTPLTNPTSDDLYIHLRNVGPVKISSKYGATRIYDDSSEVTNWTEENLVAGAHAAVRLDNIAGNNFVVESAYQLKGIYIGTGFENCTITGLENTGVFGEMLGIEAHSAFGNPIDISNYKGMYCAVGYGADQYTPTFTIDDPEMFGQNNPGMKVLQLRDKAFPLEYVGSMSTLQQVSRPSGNIGNIHSSDLRLLILGWNEVLTGTVEGLVANCRTAGKTSGVILISNSQNANCHITYNGEAIGTGSLYVHFTSDSITVNSDSTGYVGPQIPKNNWV